MLRCAHIHRAPQIAMAEVLIQAVAAQQKYIAGVDTELLYLKAQWLSGADCTCQGASARLGQGLLTAQLLFIHELLH